MKRHTNVFVCSNDPITANEAELSFAFDGVRARCFFEGDLDSDFEDSSKFDYKIRVGLKEEATMENLISLVDMVAIFGDYEENDFAKELSIAKEYNKEIRIVKPKVFLV